MKTVEEISWSLTVQSVGGTHKNKNFTLQINPESSISKLQAHIADVTGLSPPQQRLIYRGRILSNDLDGKVSDVTGLDDGHTIHLVPRPSEVQPQSVVSSRRGNNSNNNDITGTSWPSSIPLLMGLAQAFGGESHAENNSTEENMNEEDENEELISQRASEVASALRANSVRTSSSHRDWQRNSFRIPNSSSQEDGSSFGTTASTSSNNRNRYERSNQSLESIRQSIMTCHTVLNYQQARQNNQSHITEVSQRPVDAVEFDANRRWYRGQWIDCRDTVNQWLEATIIDIAYPDDVLSGSDEERRDGDDEDFTIPSSRAYREQAVDPIIAANDLDGRARLLQQNNYRGSEERSSNVQLLLVHYNGWPNRWNEWIRSDSQRLRPFRTRTKHSNNTNHVSPTPDSIYPDAPSTVIQEDLDDRAALLGELSRALSSVNSILAAHAPRQFEEETAIRNSRDLPWANFTDNPNLDRQSLLSLAPLLDRLGRSLTDAAPHILALANELPVETEVEATSSTPLLNNEPNDVEDPLEGNDPNLDDFAPLFSEAPTPVPSDLETTSEDYVNGLVNAQSNDESSSGSGLTSVLGEGGLGTAEALALLFGGLDRTNTTVVDGSNDNNGSLSGLTRLLRSNNGSVGIGGGAGGGIDIHIHAVVTPSGNDAGVSSRANNPDIPTTPNHTRRRVGPTTFSALPTYPENEEVDLFDDLYGEIGDNLSGPVRNISSDFFDSNQSIPILGENHVDERDGDISAGTDDEIQDEESHEYDTDVDMGVAIDVGMPVNSPNQESTDSSTEAENASRGNRSSSRNLFSRLSRASWRRPR